MAGDLRGAKILIVDDEEMTAQVLADILRTDGYVSIEATTDPRDALSRYSAFQPDLVVLDWKMPHITGAQVLRQIRSVCAAQSYLPIIVVTADVRPESRNEALGNGATDFVTKPYDPLEILLRVRNLLETRFLHLRISVKQTELEARLLETRRLATAIANVSSGVVISDPNQPDNPVIYANPGFYALTGYTADEVLGRNCRFLQGPGTDPAAVAGMREAIARKKVFAGKLLNYRKDGTTFWNRLTVNPIFDEQQRLINFVGIQTDVTEQQQAEESVRFQAHILDSIGEAVVATDPAGKILYTNRFAQSLYGWDGEQIIGRDVVDTFTPRPSREQGARRMELLGRGEIWSGTFPVKRRDGTTFEAEVTNSPLFDEVGNLLAVIGISSDITNRRAAEEALRQAQERFRAFYDENPLMLITVDTSNMIQSISRFGARQLGYEPEELSGKSILELHYEADRQAATDYLKNALAHPGEIEPIEIRKCRRDGSMLWARVRARAVRHGGEQLVLIACEDISKRKEAQEQLDRFFTLSVDMLCTAGFDGYFERLNPAWEATLGWTREELMSEPFIEFVHPDDRAFTAAETQRLTTELDRVGFENRYRCKDGTYKSLLWSTRVDPENRLFYAAARDISARKETEEAIQQARREAERANRAKSEFLSRMSHELRTPLNAILGFGQILEMDVSAPDEVQGVQQILKAGRHLLELVNEVLDISRIEAGRLALSIEPVAMEEAMGDATDLVKTLAANRNVRIEQRTWSQHLLADRQRLKQVFHNLLSNAVKYNREGGSVTISGEETANGTLRVSVLDTGRGISPDKMSKLFVPFERSGADEFKAQGTGLGLAISQRLVALMGGAMTVESTVNVGSTFTVELPLAPAPAEHGPAEASTASAAAGGSWAVLYIEDNFPNLRVVEHIMARRSGVRLLTAMQGRLGLEMALEHRPDLILLDLHLPDIGGDEVLEQLQRDDRTAEIPVVILSADATANQLERLKAAGARDYLTKPIDVRSFMETLNRLLNGNRTAGAP